MRNLILFGVAALLVSLPATLRAQDAHDPRPEVHFFGGGHYGDRTSDVAVGEIVDIHGKNFGQKQGKWVVEIFRGEKAYRLPVLEWTPTRVRVRVPDTMAPEHYTLHFVVPGRLLQSNHQPVTVHARGGAGQLTRVYPTTVYSGNLLHLYLGDVQGDMSQTFAQIKPARGGSLTDMEVRVRRNRYLKVVVPEGLKPGNYEVSVSIPGALLGSKPITVIESSGTTFSPVLRIEAVESAKTKAITCGEVIHILGQGFGYDRDKKRVEFVEVVGGRAAPHRMTVNESDWGPSQIVLRIPRDFKPGEYLVRVWDDRNDRSTNTLKVRVVGPVVRIGGQTTPGQGEAVPGMQLEAVEPKSVAPGGALVLRGMHFGLRQGDKIIAINHNGHTGRLSILEWSDERIRARVPAGLDPGTYRVLIYADASMKTSSNSLTVTIKRPRANRGASLDLFTLFALEMNGIAAPVDLDSDPAADGAESATAQARELKKRKNAAADLAAVSIRDDRDVATYTTPHGQRLTAVHHDIVGEVKNISKVKYVGDCQITLSQGTVRGDLIGAEPCVLKTMTLRTLDAGESYFIKTSAMERDIYDPQTIYILEISHRDSNAENNKITKVFKRQHIPAPMPEKKYKSAQLESIKPTGSNTPDLAAVSIRHDSRVIKKLSFGPGAQINQDRIIGEVKNLGKHRFDGHCTITLSEGTLQDDGSIAPNPRLLKKTVLFELGPGESHLLRVDVEAGYFDPKIYILNVSYEDDNQKNNKLTKVFKRSDR